MGLGETNIEKDGQEHTTLPRSTVLMKNNNVGREERRIP